MKKKNIVRITENELHRIIKESVDRIITELDWKTYMSAAQKDKDPQRSQRFRNQGIDTFNKEFGYEEDGINGSESTYLMPNGTLKHNSRDNQDRLEYVNQFATPNDVDPNDQQPTQHYVNGRGRMSSTQRQVKRPYTNSKPHARAMQKAEDEHRAWRKDNYVYNKGQGYHNTEDKTDWHDYLGYNNDRNI